jgi:hypothetical protein
MPDELRIAACGMKKVAAEPPNLRLPLRACAGRLYKQTQSGAPQVVSAGQFCQTKPIPPVGRGAAGERCKTKPNLGALGYLGAGRAGPWPEPIRQNKANLGKPGRQNRQGRLCQTKPILPAGTREWTQATSPGGLAGEQLCETNPIR